MARRQRRLRGEGSVRRRADGRLELRLYAGRDPATGRPRRVSLYGRSEAELQDQARRWRATQVAGAPVQARRLTVAAYLDEWLQHVLPESGRRPSTQALYARVLRRHVLPALGRLPLAALQPPHLYRLYSQLRARPLRPLTIRLVHEVLAVALQDAVRLQLLAQNPARGAAPAAARAEATVLSYPEWEALRAYACTSDHWLAAALAIMLVAPLRAGELLGLQWGDIDLAAARLHVRRQVQWQAGALVVTAPKTTAARRTLPLAPWACAVLQRYRARQRPAPAPDGWLFPSARDAREPRRHARLLEAYYRVLERVLGRRVRFHALRHTFASHALHEGWSVLEVQRMLGHARPTITLDVYAHSVPDALESQLRRRLAAFHQTPDAADDPPAPP